jgi:aryl-alcohol dehydrogenase-like predicted oxidoreductase
VQTEYSLFERTPEVNGVLETTRDLGIAFVAYSPLGHGILTGTITSTENLDQGDFRKHNPRFDDTNLVANLELVDNLRILAASWGATPGQLAIAWLLHQDGVVVIPGTKRRRFLEENVAAVDLRLTVAQVEAIGEALPMGSVQGERYTPAGMAMVYRKGVRTG